MKVRTELGLYEDIEKVVPPTQTFPYWTMYPTDESKCFFILMYNAKWLELEEVQEENGTISQHTLSDLLSEHPD